MFFADLHIHSKYSRATSKYSDLENNYIFGCNKGLDLIGTGDCTHPLWFNELEDKLIKQANGLYILKNSILNDLKNKISASCFKTIFFMPTVEISTIYKKNNKCRKIHHLLHFSSLEKVKIFNSKLDKLGNIKHDGRPILGLDSKILLELMLDIDNDAFLIPAHIWTPWFSVLGYKSGFDTIEKCYEDLISEIFAVETGLSSDPIMNWKISNLDKFRLVSNSDCHSSQNLGREATIFNFNEISYANIKNALKYGDGYYGTVEIFPEEGKYFTNGCRKCNFFCDSLAIEKNIGICPKCNGKITIGVEYRVDMLSDKFNKQSIKPKTGGEIIYTIPLIEIIAQTENLNITSKKVKQIYNNLINNFDCELNILLNSSFGQLEKMYNRKFAIIVDNLKKQNVKKFPGFDGQHGKIVVLEK